MSVVDYLPVWKKNSTPEEWFMELASIARRHPERFGKVVVVFEEMTERGAAKYGYHCRNCKTLELLGLLVAGKDAVDDYTRRDNG